MIKKKRKYTRKVTVSPYAYRLELTPWQMVCLEAGLSLLEKGNLVEPISLQALKDKLANTPYTS
jgi:hypothetical protein